MTASFIQLVMKGREENGMRGVGWVCVCVCVLVVVGAGRGVMNDLLTNDTRSYDEGKTLT